MFIPLPIALLIASIILFVVARLAAERLIKNHHAQKVDFFERFPVQPGDIVFLGDSITDGGRWHEMFPGLPVRNRGINADTTLAVLDRLDCLLSGRPAAIFLLIGTNDLPWYEHRKDSAILETYDQILRRMHDETPGTRVFVQSILPREKRYAKRIQGLNTRLKEMAAQYGYTFIDLFPHFASPDGRLRAELNNDQLHLLGGGYLLWRDILQPYLNEFRKP